MYPGTQFEARESAVDEVLVDRRHVLEIQARTLARARAVEEELRIASEVERAWGEHVGARWWFNPAAAVAELELVLQALQRVDGKVRDSLALLDARLGRPVSE
jgi:hypothetical protein